MECEKNACFRQVQFLHLLYLFIALKHTFLALSSLDTKIGLITNFTNRNSLFIMKKQRKLLNREGSVGMEEYQVLSGAERFYIEGSEIGILLSHGFIGTPQSVEYVGRRLGELGYSVLAPRLKGHGTHHHDLEKCGYQDWYQSLKEGYEELKKSCSTILIMGQSMGGTLSLCLAAEKVDIDGIILINPALSVPSLEYLAHETDIRSIPEGKPDIKDPGALEIVYDKAPVKAIQQLQELMNHTSKKLKEINCPVLAFKSVEDHVVPHENTDHIMKQVLSECKRSITLKNSYHVATLDYDKDIIVEESHSFIQTQIKGLEYA